MDRLRALLADAGRYFGQMTKREQLLVGLAALSVVVFVGSITFATISRAIAGAESRIEEKTANLQQVSVYAQTFAASERTRRELEARLGGPPVRLLSHMQELADKHGLTISSMNDKGEQPNGQVVESTVELHIASGAIEKLNALVNEIERNPRIIKVKKLRLRTLSGDEKSLNATITVATYALKSS